MSRLAVRSELIKLSRTLSIEPEELEFLAEIPAEQLRDLRVGVYELLFNQDRALFRRLARLLVRLPAGLTVRLAERAGPLLTARVVAELPSRRAAELVARAPTAFIADAVADLDPRRTGDLIRQQPVERVVAISQELADRGDFITMSRFPDFISEDALRAVVDAIEDEGALLRIAFFMGSKNRIDHLFRLLPRDRLEALLLQVEDQSRDLLSPFLSLLVHVSYGFKRELGDLAAGQDTEVLTEYVRATQEQALWGDMLPVVAAMSEASQHKVVNLPVLREPVVQESIVRAADQEGLWGLVLPLVALMDDANREAVAGIVAGKPPGTLERAADAALLGEHWEPLLDLVRRMPPAKQEEFAGFVRVFGEVDPDLLRRIARRADAHDFGERFAVGEAESAPPPAG